mgnify:CR=1 FL=1
MLRIIFDTNIYSFIAEDKNVKEITARIKNNKELRVYGYRLIKEEIKNIPKTREYETHKYRTLLINLYSDLIKEQYSESPNITKLAELYYKEFQKLGGKRSFQDLKVDFGIVACATIHHLDLIVSGDEKTLKGNIALEAYKNVNIRNKLRTPNFYNFEDLKKAIGLSL